MPSRFGGNWRGDPDWECVCGHVNKGSIKYLVGKRICCMMCGIEKDLADLAKLTPDLEEK